MHEKRGKKLTVPLLSRDRCPRARRVLLFLLPPSLTIYPYYTYKNIHTRVCRKRQLSQREGIFSYFSRALTKAVFAAPAVQGVRIVVDACKRLRKRWQDNGPFKAAFFIFAN